jgi:peptidoglycan/LPS O-acetylase OafA/YrhL
MRREPGLDLLRAVAIVWVMLYHLASYDVPLPGIVRHGWMGVDLFFVLSGYLLGWQILQPYTRGETPLWRRFFLGRAFRVLPAYFAVLGLYFAVPAVRESEGIAPAWQFLTFTTNLFPDYFHNRAFSHAWSLCVEEHFYLLLPASVWLLARRPGYASAAGAIAFVLVGGALLRGWLWQHDVAPYAHVLSGEGNFFVRFVESIYNPTYTRLDGLLAGVALAAVRAFRTTWWTRAMRAGPLLLIPGLAGVAASMCLEPASCLGAVVLYPLLSASLALVMAAALSPRTWPGRFSVPGARPIAAISFSLYLTHKAAYHAIDDRFGPVLENAPLVAFGLYIGTALIVAALLYVVVERTGLRVRDRLLGHAGGRDTRAGGQVSGVTDCGRAG